MKRRRNLQFTCVYIACLFLLALSLSFFAAVALKFDFYANKRELSEWKEGGREISSMESLNWQLKKSEDALKIL